MKYLILIPILIITYLVASKYVVATKVECFTQLGNCPAFYQTISTKLLHTPLLLPLSADSLVETYKKNPEVRSVKIFRRLPQTIVVNLELRFPVGSIGSDLTGDSARLVDASGFVLGSATDSSTPLLIVADFNPDFKTVSQNYVLALKILHKISQLTETRVIGSLDGSQVTATYQDGPKILIDITGNIDAWYFPLQQILKRSRIGTKSISKIDLRFSNPVLSY